MKPILQINGISKKFRIRHLPGGYLSLRERLTNLRFDKSVEEDFWALREVSFDVAPGESVGIVGRNGAGKSTLLKILSKITPPTKGKIIARGRIASLLEVGTGFHPELTGRENIFFNGALLGMRRREIENRFDEIVDFSGVEKFLDTPLKHFSSGMQLRLAFSVAAFLDPEILIIDEVLAVGDAEFQKKCLGKMEDVSKSGRTILFVSHNMISVQTLCNRAVMLDGGSIVKQGPVGEVLTFYQSKIEMNVTDRWQRPSREKVTPISFESINVGIRGDQPNQQVVLTAELKSSLKHSKAFIAFDFKTSMGTTFMQALPSLEPFIDYSDKTQHVSVSVDLPPLVPDKYYVSAWIGAHNLECYDSVNDAVSFDVLQSPTVGRIFPHTFDHGMIVPHSNYRINK